MTEEGSRRIAENVFSDSGDSDEPFEYSNDQSADESFEYTNDQSENEYDDNLFAELLVPLAEE